MVKNYMKLLELKDRMVVDKNVWRKKNSCTKSNINFLTLLNHIANPKLLKLKLIDLVWFVSML